MIPVEDPAGGAAAGLHQKPEWTPDQHADKVTHIEAHADHKQNHLADDPGPIQDADHYDQPAPKQKNLICGPGRCQDIASQCLVIDFIPDRLKAIGKQLHRSQRQFVFNGDDLQDHIRNPNQPKDMQQRRSGKEVCSFEDIKLLWREKAEDAANRKNDTSADQP